MIAYKVFRKDNEKLISFITPVKEGGLIYKKRSLNKPKIRGSLSSVVAENSRSLDLEMNATHYP